MIDHRLMHRVITMIHRFDPTALYTNIFHNKNMSRHNRALVHDRFKLNRELVVVLGVRVIRQYMSTIGNCQHEAKHTDTHKQCHM